MKKLLLFSLVIMGNIMSAQTIMKLDDPHIVAQEKRQVFQQWGDWQPKGKYFLGIQYNWHYTMVWGWAAPSRNRDYRDGKDIRPLSPTGLQNQRYASTLIQEEQTDKIKEHSDIVHDETFDEYMHISSLSTEADPLYILYYKRSLRDLLNSEAINDSNKWNKLEEIGMNRGTYLRYAVNHNYGVIDKLVLDIGTLADKYKIARTVDMPRGKRILMYHECLVEWRQIIRYIGYLNNQSLFIQRAEKKINTVKRKSKIPGAKQRRDAEILHDILMSNPMY